MQILKFATLVALLPLSTFAAESYRCKLDAPASAQVFKDRIKEQIAYQAKARSKQMEAGNAYSLVMKATEAGITANEQGSVQIVADEAKHQVQRISVQRSSFEENFNKLPEDTLVKLPVVKAAVAKARAGTVVAADLDPVVEAITKFPAAKKWKPKKESKDLPLGDGWAMYPSDEKGRETIGHLLGGRKDLEFAYASEYGMLLMKKTDHGPVLSFMEREFACEKLPAKAPEVTEDTENHDAT